MRLNRQSRYRGPEQDDRRFSRYSFGESGGYDRGRRSSTGRRHGRLLEQGDLRLLILHLINEKPRHGYEVIKAIEELTGGNYAPSPGVVYPTLTLLEDLDQAVATAEGSRKSYAITPSGATALASEQTAVDAILSRFADARPREDAMPVMRAMENLGNVLRMKFRNAAASAELTRRIVDTLDAIARKIEEM